MRIERAGKLQPVTQREKPALGQAPLKMLSSKTEKFFTTKNTKDTKREGLEIFVSFVVR